MIKKLKIKLRKSDNHSLFHNSKGRRKSLKEVSNALIDKVNELTDKVNEFDKNSETK